MYIYGSKNGRGDRRREKVFIELLMNIEIIYNGWALKGNSNVKYSDCIGSNMENRHKTEKGNS